MRDIYEEYVVPELAKVGTAADYMNLVQVWCGAVWCCVVLCGAGWCCVVLCGAVWCCVVLCGAVYAV